MLYRSTGTVPAPRVTPAMVVTVPATCRSASSYSAAPANNCWLSRYSAPVPSKCSRESTCTSTSKALQSIIHSLTFTHSIRPEEKPDGSTTCHSVQASKQHPITCSIVLLELLRLWWRRPGCSPRYCLAVASSAEFPLMLALPQSPKPW